MRHGVCEVEMEKGQRDGRFSEELTEPPLSKCGAGPTGGVLKHHRWGVTNGKVHVTMAQLQNIKTLALGPAVAPGQIIVVSDFFH